MWSVTRGDILGSFLLNFEHSSSEFECHFDNICISVLLALYSHAPAANFLS